MAQQNEEKSGTVSVDRRVAYLAVLGSVAVIVSLGVWTWILNERQDHTKTQKDVLEKRVDSLNTANRYLTLQEVSEEMYASLSWQVPAGGQDSGNFETRFLALITGRKYCKLLDNSYIFELESKVDYIEINDEILKILEATQDPVRYCFFRHPRRGPLRGAFVDAYQEQLAKEIRGAD